MKRKDLKIGEDYLLDSSHDWDTWQPRTRVRVASLDPLYMYNPSRYRWEEGDEHDLTLSDGRTIRVHKTIQPAIPGTSTEREASRLVLVEMGHTAEKDDPNPAYHLVRLTQIRAPWAEAVKAYEKMTAEREKNERAKAAKEADLRQRIATIDDTINTRLGRKVYAHARDNFTSVSIPLKDLEELLGL